MKIFSNPCKKRDRKATEQAILMAASKLFAQKGYESTRTLEIAKEANANEALITRYFGGKEGLLIALMKDEAAMKSGVDVDRCSQLELFPSKSEVKDLKEGILTFFKNGQKSFKIKQEFVRIGCSRAMIDPEMAEVIRSHILDKHLPQMVTQLATYFEGKKIKKSELESLGFLIMSLNFNMNFMGREIYGIESDQIKSIFDLVASSLQSYLVQD
jgi:AcrR family transcriptional regulator